MTRNHWHLATLLMALGISACSSKSSHHEADGNTTAQDTTHAAADQQKDWNYQGETGPEHWPEIVPNACAGEHQSPIDIINPIVNEALKPLDIHYSDKTSIHDVTNNGHSIQFNFEPGDYIMVNGVKYLLKQFHFHEPAEHTINGVRFPLVLHLVHMSQDNHYAVIAIMGKEAPTNNKVYTFLDEHLPIQVNETKAIDQNFNMNDLFPQNKAYFTYTGSLTTPPCTEGVTWFILQNPISVSLEMIQDLHDLMPVNNYRNLQPLHNRKIEMSR